MPFFAAQHSLFRAYDIRGTNSYFTGEFVQALGHTFADLYSANQSQLTQSLAQDINTNDISANITTDIDHSTETTVNTQQDTVAENIVVIGYDMRFGSNTIARTLSTILTKQGLRVIQLGLITTPMMAFWAEQYQGHGIIVTASHSAKDILGIKWLINHKSPSSLEIQTLYQQIIAYRTHYSPKSYFPEKQAKHTTLDSDHKNSSNDNELSNHLLKPLHAKQVADVYIDAIEKVFQQLPHHTQKLSSKNKKTLAKLDLVVVIDCMHGATGNLAQQLFERFCQHVIVLNDTPDGNFPLGNPDPAEPNRLTQLQQTVVSHTADIGLAFDGDGDRLMIVDNNGKVVTPDHLLYLLARVAVAERQTSAANALSISQVLFDIKCTHHLPKLLSDIGATPIISKTGSSFMRQQLQNANNKIIFAGELSGHFIFNDGRFIAYDDAMYAALRLLHWFAEFRYDSHNKKRLSDITQGLPAMVNTADHYLPMPPTVVTECSIIEQLTRLCRNLQRSVETATPHNSASTLAQLRETVLPATPYESPICTCVTVRSDITLDQAQCVLPAGTRLSCIDGVRLDFAHGFGVLRQSNTSNSLTARFAGDSMDDLKDIQATFAALCRPFNAELATQIVAMPAE